MKTQYRFVFFFALIAALLFCSSWGFLMHRTQVQLSVYQLPAGMQPFFRHNLDYLVRHCVRPDQRRNEDSTEDTKHFIDLEAYGPDAANNMPFDWASAVARHTKDSLLKYGYVPYWVVEMQGRLTQAFRAGKGDSILFYAADLAHYIQDAHVPLHTTLNYDGQLTNQRGLHSLWESTVPELLIDQFSLKANKKAAYINNPAQAIWKAVRQAHKLLPGVLETERRISLGFTDSTKYRFQQRNGRQVRSYSAPFARAYGKALQPTINRQALRAANLVANFWYTAWVDAGRPNLETLLRRSWQSADGERLQQEIKAYRKNQLLKKGWLMAKENVSAP